MTAPRDNTPGKFPAALAALRRRAAALVLLLFLLAVLTGAGELLLPVLGPTQPGMLLTALAAGGGFFFLGALLAHLAAALLLGRVFCSWLCPLGILQDAAARFAPGRRKTLRHAKDGLWRLAAPLLLAGCLAGGSTWLFGLAEPYSLFARSAQSVGQPLYALAHNALALAGGGAFALPLVPWHLDFAGLALAVPLLTAVLIFARGRGWCNSVCPVGALLGLAGKAALLRPRFTTRCKACGLCERRCKARCLDTGAATVDASRCVACYNCLEACPRGGLALLPQAPAFVPARSLVLRGGLAALFLLSLAPAASTVRGALAPGKNDAASGDPVPHSGGLSDTSPHHSMPVLPPGAASLARLESLCTGCHSCVSACPPGVLTVSGPFVWEQSELARMALPAMDFFRAFCQVGCTRCTEVCPSKALRTVSPEAKKRLQLGRAVFVEPLCIIITKKTRCGACAEHCPTGALVMTPQPALGGVALPRIDQSLCIGCGACQFACPVRPAQAVEVVALARHGIAAPPKPKQKDIEAGEAFPF